MANYIQYANQGAVRSQPVSPELAQAFSFLPEMGVGMNVFSGGQPEKGSGLPRVGSVRHDHGGAADVFFTKDGRRLDWANEADVPIFQEIVRQAKSRGVTGFGAGPGYMQPASMHVGFGNPAVWGSGGKGANAPQWLREAYGAAPSAMPSDGRVSMSTKGTGFMPQQEQAPKGILGFLGIEKQDPSAGGQTAQPFYQRDRFKDAMGRVAVASSIASGNPNPTLINAMADARDRRAGQKGANRTMEWLSQQPNGETFIRMIDAGASPAQALSAYQQAMTPAAADPTSAMRNYEFLLAQGADPKDAMARAFSGGTTVNVGGEGPQVGTIPQGYQLVDDGGVYRMEPIAGGPADTTQTDAAAGEQTTRAATVVLDDIQSLKSTIESSEIPITGLIGSVASGVAGTPQYDASKTIQTIVGNIGFDRLQQMRDASPTGGALGAISERELSTLQSVMGSLDQGQSKEQFLKNLERLESIYTDIMRKASAYPNASQYGYSGGGAPVAAPASEALSDEDLLSKYGG